MHDKHTRGFTSQIAAELDCYIFRYSHLYSGLKVCVHKQDAIRPGKIHFSN